MPVRSDLISESYEQIALRWAEYGPDEALYPELWDDSLVLATLGPQTNREWKTPEGNPGAIDFGPGKYHGTLTNGPVWTKAQYRGRGFGSVSFDGSDDYVNSGNPGAFATGRPVITTTAWLYPRALIAGGSVAVSHSELGTNHRTVHLSMTDAASYAQRADASNFHTVTGPALAINNWSHLVFLYDGTVLHFFINGIEVGTPYTSTISVNAPTRLHIGLSATGLWDSTFPYPFDGLICDVRTYSVVLSAPKIATLARHPLEAYRCKQRRVWFTPGVAPPAGTTKSRIIGGGVL